LTDPTPEPRRRRKPRFGGIALGIAGISASISMLIYVRGLGGGYGGWGAVLASAVLAMVGGIVAGGFAVVSIIRGEVPMWPALLALVIASGVALWLNAFA
jgi:hypothetical protein